MSDSNLLESFAPIERTYGSPSDVMTAVIEVATRINPDVLSYPDAINLIKRLTLEYVRQHSGICLPIGNIMGGVSVFLKLKYPKFGTTESVAHIQKYPNVIVRRFNMHEELLGKLESNLPMIQVQSSNE